MLKVLLAYSARKRVSERLEGAYEHIVYWRKKFINKITRLLINGLMTHL